MAAIASGSKEKVTFIEEASFGILPGSPIFREVNVTANNMNPTKETASSAHIRSDTNIVGLFEASAGAGGDLPNELHYGFANHQWLEAAWRSEFEADVGISGATTISFDASDNSINDTGSGLGATQPNQFIRLAGASLNADGLMKVVSVTAAKVVIDAVTRVLVTEAAGPAITIDGRFMANSTTNRSYAFQREYTDLTAPLAFDLSIGQRLGAQGFSITPGSAITVSNTFVGKDSTPATSTASTGGTPIAAPTTKSMNAVGNVFDLRIGGILTTDALTNVNFDLDLSVEPNQAIGSSTPIEVSTHSLNLSGNITMFFQNQDQATIFKNLIDTSLSLGIQDNLSNIYYIDLPHINFTSHAIENTGVNTTESVSMDFTATLDTVSDATILITRFDAP